MPVPLTLRATTDAVLLPAHASAVAVARRRVARSLLELEVPDAVVADAELVVSELMDNAVRHARPLHGDRIRVVWRVRPTEVELAVSDGGAPWYPRVERPPADADSGRGLGIVSSLAQSWGVEGAGTPQQLVWAVLSFGGGPR